MFDSSLITCSVSKDTASLGLDEYVYADRNQCQDTEYIYTNWHHRPYAAAAAGGAALLRRFLDKDPTRGMIQAS